MTLLPLRHLHATGDYWAAPSYLDGSGKVMKAAPEFFWHEEVQRLAEKYRDKDSKGMKVRGAPDEDSFLTYNYYSDAPEKEDKDRAASAPDLSDFADALKTGRLKTADATAATEAHKNARAAIDAEKPLPGGEADSEFADYHAGAAAPDKPEAAAAWQKLLARPKEERHYRSVWAAFMLGKNALAAKQWAEASKYFQQCRALAREGFADSLALAADSYGWEGRAELMAEHYPQASRLYLTQLALGDSSAGVSLKRCIPGWMSPASGGLPGEEMVDSDQEKPVPPTPDEAKTTARWKDAAGDPALQELITAHILATDTAEYTEDFTRSTHWLDVLTKAGVEKVEDANRLAWLAYNAGDYKSARRWLAKADAKSPLARWLEAKFALRDGKLDAASLIMPEVAQGVPAGQNYAYIVTPHDRARGEAAALLYAKGQFAEAFAAFVEGNCEEDMKFMIESILTVDELIAAAAKIPAPKPPAKDAEGHEIPPLNLTSSNYSWRSSSTRSQIGRRLIREGKVKDGRPLLTEEERKLMEDYIAFAVKAEDKNVSATDRAKAWWDAADLMLDSGHEFRGTEADFHRPQNDSGDWTVREQRVAGTFNPEPYADPAEKKPVRKPVFIPATATEKKRLAATAKQHAKPMRTRMVAIGHLLKAAGLLPEGTEEKARALNTAGYWLQDIDNPAADQIFARISNAYAATPTGKAVVKKRWFTGYTNPWKADAPDDGVE